MPSMKTDGFFDKFKFNTTLSLNYLPYFIFIIRMQ